MRRHKTGVGALALVALGIGGCTAASDRPPNMGQPVQLGAPEATAAQSLPTSSNEPTITESGPPSPVPSSPPTVSPGALGPPRALRFAGDSSPVVAVGADALQNLEIPRDIDTLGWWRGGATPGAANGFVVITGHATRRGDGAANAWWGAEPGNTVTIGAARGTATYRVVSRKTYDKDQIPLARWFPARGPSGPPGLALITCADYRDGEWQANTVIEAIPV